KTLSRAEYFLVADRPEASLGAVRRKPDEREPLREAPQDVLVVDGQLLLLFATAVAIRLERRDGTVAFHSEAKIPTGWFNRGLGRRHLPADRKLVFFTVDWDGKNWDQITRRHVAFTIWDYR